MIIAIIRTAFPSRVRIDATGRLDGELGIALLRPGQSYLGVPYSFWERHVGRDVEIEVVREECGEAGELVSVLGVPPAQHCPRCGARLTEGCVSVRSTPANLMPVGARGTALYFSAGDSAAERILNYQTPLPARRCPICGGLWLDLLEE